MNTQKQKAFSYSMIAASVGIALNVGVAPVATAQEAQIERIEVTATRRVGGIQETPLNITALTSDVLEEQNIGQLEDVARWVPGLPRPTWVVPTNGCSSSHGSGSPSAARGALSRHRPGGRCLRAILEKIEK